MTVKPMRWVSIAAMATALALGSASAIAKEKKAEDRKGWNENPFPSSYVPRPSAPVLLKNATVYDGLGKIIENASILLKEGKIAAVGTDIAAPEGATVIDATGKVITPGIIDVHSHLGVYPTPSVPSREDGNEMTAPVTAHVWAEHSLWPQDPGFGRALAGGVTTLQLLPGSANLVGGRSVTIKNVGGLTARDMKFPDAPYGVKMACGENPKRVYGKKGGPATAMGNMAGFRQTFADADSYRAKWKAYLDGKGDKPSRDLKMETLALVLDGKAIVHNHCYRADEMQMMIDLSHEYGFKIGTFHHAVESYKIADRLAGEGICSAMWADWWGFKMESYDGIRENIPFVHAKGACAIVHSDSANGIQRLNQEAAKALADGNRAGLKISKAEAWTWLSLNPAKALGIADKTGSLEVGKMADVVLWNRDPFSTYAQAEKVYIDGALTFDRANPAVNPVSDFELGQPGEGDVK